MAPVRVRWLRLLFFALIVRPVVGIVFGLNVRHRERIPRAGPAIVVANHNSHLDTLVLMSLFPLPTLPKLHPVAAMDYFMRSKALAWFSLNIIGIIPIERGAREKGVDPLVGPSEALGRGELVILFPEGTRGEPEHLATFKKGVSFLAERNASVPAIPIFMRGVGRSLPKGAAIPVPLFLDVFVGKPVYWKGNRDAYMRELRAAVEKLAGEGQPRQWA